MIVHTPSFPEAGDRHLFMDNPVVDKAQRGQEAAWRVRIVIAAAVTAIFVSFTAMGLADANWVVAGVLGAMSLFAVARMCLMVASRQPVSWVGTAVILISGPRRFIAESGVRGRE